MTPQRFVLIGEGQPLSRAIQQLEADPRAEIAVIFSDEASSGALKHAAENASVLAAGEIKTDVGLAALTSGAADWFFSINNFAHLIPKPVLARFPDHAVNLHLGLLPEYAGRHAYQWALRRGENETGVTLHVMNDVFDSGAILKIRREPIGENDTGLSLFSRCTRAGVAATQELFEEILSGQPPALQPQDLSRRHAFRDRDVGDGHIDWNQPAQQVRDFVRAANFGPFPSPSYRPWSFTTAGERMDVISVGMTDETSVEPVGTIVDLGDDRRGCVCSNSIVELLKLKCDGAPVALADISLGAQWR